MRGRTRHAPPHVRPLLPLWTKVLSGVEKEFSASESSFRRWKGSTGDTLPITRLSREGEI